jgi:hypothetical protein
MALAAYLLRQYTPAYVSISQHTSAYYEASWRRKLDGIGRLSHMPAYASIRQHTPAYASIRQHTSAYVSIRQHTMKRVGGGSSMALAAYFICQHTPAYASIRQHTSAYVSKHEALSNLCMRR